jgi:hypothetical protein
MTIVAVIRFEFKVSSTFLFLHLTVDWSCDSVGRVGSQRKGLSKEGKVKSDAINIKWKKGN